MDEALILKRLDSISEEIRSLKSDVLQELKEDLAPIIKQATPHVVSFLSDVEGQYSNEELANLIKNLLTNIGNLNSMLDMLKAGMELKDDLGPVTKQSLPKVTEFMAELDGKLSAEELSTLLRKTLSNLDNFNEALDMLKAGMELKDDLGPVAKQTLPKVTEFMAELDGQFSAEELTALLRKTLSNLGNFNEALDMLKAGMELKDDLGPVAKQALPKVTEFMAELDGQFSASELTALLRKTLSNLDNFNEALDMLKAGMELKDDLGPVAKQALPKVTEFMADLDGQFSGEELTALLRKTLSNLGNFNEALDMLKAGMELKDDLGPVAKQALPKITEFMAELDDQFSAEELTALLRKTLSNLDNFNTALDMLKAGMELKDELGPVAKQTLPKVTEFMAELDGQFSGEELTSLLRKTLSNLDNFNTALDMLKAGMELKDELGPVAKQTLPKITQFMAELDGQFSAEELTALMRKSLTNLQHLNAALDMLKAGMEFKDEFGPIIKQGWPKVMAFMADLHEGEFKAEHLGDLLRTFLLNVQTFSDLMNLVKPGTELIDEIKSIMKQYDVYSKTSRLLWDLEQRGVFRVLEMVSGYMKEIRFSDEQLELIQAAIAEIDLGKPSYVGPFEMVNEIRDPNVQETLGAAFKVMRVVGCCLRASRMRQVGEDYTDEYPAMTSVGNQ